MNPQRVQLMQSFREGRRDERAHGRLCKRAVEREIDVGDASGRGETAFIGSVIAAQRANVIERPRLAAHEPVARDQIRAGDALRLRF